MVQNAGRGIFRNIPERHLSGVPKPYAFFEADAGCPVSVPNHVLTQAPESAPAFPTGETFAQPSCGKLHLTPPHPFLTGHQ